MNQGSAKEAALRLAATLGFTFVPQETVFEETVKPYLKERVTPFKAFLTDRNGRQLWAIGDWIEGYYLVLGISLGLSLSIDRQPELKVAS